MSDVRGGSCARTCPNPATVFVTDTESEFPHWRCSTCAEKERALGWITPEAPTDD